MTALRSSTKWRSRTSPYPPMSRQICPYNTTPVMVYVVPTHELASSEAPLFHDRFLARRSLAHLYSANLQLGPLGRKSMTDWWWIASHSSAVQSPLSRPVGLRTILLCKYFGNLLFYACDH